MTPNLCILNQNWLSYSGPIDTPMFRKSAEIRGTKMDTDFLALKRTGDQKEVPPLIEFLISDASSFITGVAMPIDGSWFC